MVICIRDLALELTEFCLMYQMYARYSSAKLLHYFQDETSRAHSLMLLLHLVQGTLLPFPSVSFSCLQLWQQVALFVNTCRSSVWA